MTRLVLALDPKLNSQEFGVVGHLWVVTTQASNKAGIECREHYRLHSRDLAIDVRELRMSLKHECGPADSE